MFSLSKRETRLMVRASSYGQYTYSMHIDFFRGSIFLNILATLIDLVSINEKKRIMLRVCKLGLIPAQVSCHFAMAWEKQWFVTPFSPSLSRGNNIFAEFSFSSEILFCIIIAKRSGNCRIFLVVFLFSPSSLASSYFCWSSCTLVGPKEMFIIQYHSRRSFFF